MSRKRSHNRFSKPVINEADDCTLRPNGYLVSTGTDPIDPLNHQSKDKTEELESNIVVTDSDLSILFDEVLIVCSIPLHASPVDLEYSD